MDIDVDGKDIGRLDFELFGASSPKSVNNFIGFLTGDFDRYCQYQGSMITRIYEQRFFQGGDFMRNDGKGTATVYGVDKMPAEQNKLKFDEPFLLAMAADEDGNTGCQFFVTLQEMPSLNGSKHTIIGRLLKGSETARTIEGIESYRKYRQESQTFFGVTQNAQKESE